MNALLGPVIQRALAKLDMFHLLQVLAGADNATPEEVSQLITVQRILDTPVAGDMAWAKLVELADAKGFTDVALNYIRSGLSVHLPDATKPESLVEAKDSLLAVIERIVNNPEIARLSAVCGCPKCGFVFGV